MKDSTVGSSQLFEAKMNENIMAVESAIDIKLAS